MKNEGVPHRVISLDDVYVIIAVFGMPDCGACEEYLPRFLDRVKAHQAQGAEFVLHQPGVIPPPRSILVVIYDVTSEDAQLQRFADRFSVTATPTTVVQKRGGGAFKTEGSLEDHKIDALLGLARQHNLR